MKSLYTSLSLLLFALIFTNSYSQNALVFDGTNDYVNCGSGSSLNITGTALTMEAWIYPTSWKANFWEGYIIGKEGIGTGYMIRTGANGTLNMNIGNGPGQGTWHELTSSSGVLSLNTWQHVAGTYDGSFLRLYVNGVVIDSLAKTVSMTGSVSVPLYIGESPTYPGREFPGRIDELRIWDVARTKAEIVSNMNNELCVIPSSLKAYYTFNQGTANGSNAGATTLTDLSGNSNTGTLTNFALSGATSNWTTGQTLVLGIVVNTNNITTCGSFTMPNGTIITTAGTYYDTLSSSSGCDSLIGYNVAFSSAHIANTTIVVECEQYTLPNGRIVTVSGIYNDTISSSGSCDTLNVYSVNISGSVDDSVFRVGARITSWDTWADHQWVRCDSGFQVIPGATNRIFNATQEGNYAVIVTRGVCVDTSECVTISFSSLPENKLNKVSIFPNPTNGLITISSENTVESVLLMDVTGKTVATTDRSVTLDLVHLPKGIYFARIKTKEGIVTKKVIKE